MEDEFTQFSNLIQEHYVGTTSDKSETAKILKSKLHVENLDFLQQFLERSVDSNLNMTVTFNFMREIIKLRGCLILIDELIGHFMFLKQFVIDNHQILLQEQSSSALQSASQDFAFTIRITFEQNEDEGEKLLNVIKEFFDEAGDIRIIALVIMTSLVDCFKVPLRHNLPNENEEIKKKFRSTYLPVFATNIIPLILEEADLILSFSLDLLCHCFSFFENTNISTISSIVYPKDLSPYFTSPDILDKIFELCFVEDQSIVKLAYKILFYMASASSVWEDHTSRADYFNHFCENMVRIIESHDEKSNYIDQTCLILNILGKSIDSDHFLSGDFAQAFLDNTIQFSSLVFASGEPSSLKNLFVFWGKIADWNLSSEDSSKIAESMLELIAEFIDTTLNAILQNDECWCELLTTEYVNSGFESIWKLAHSCRDQVYELITERINSKIPEYQTCLLQLTFLVMIVSSRFSSIRDQDSDESLSKMYEAVFGLIKQTTLIEDPMTPVFENSLIIFMDRYQNATFSSTDVKYKDEDEYQYKQNIISIFVDRILTEFDSFAFISSFQNLVDHLFSLVDNLVKKIECLNLIKDMPIKEELETQSLPISFEGVPIEDAKRPRIQLYKLYTSLIPSVRNLQAFLGKFTQRFQDIASANYSNQDEIFALFCDLRGVIKYLLINANQTAFEDIPKKYIRVCNWFSTEHVQDSVEIIERNATNPVIVNIVCNVWISLFPDCFDQMKKGKNQSLMRNMNSLSNHFDSFGIKLFKTSLSIVEAVSQNCANDSSKVYILFKLIRYCMTTKYTNFGVMSYYQDDSFEKLSTLFFQMLGEIGFDNLSDSTKVLNHILLTMSSITESEKCLNELFEAEDKTNFELIMEYTSKCMYLDCHNTEVQSSDLISRRDAAASEKVTKNTVTLRDLWVSAWNVLQPIMDKAISTEELQPSIKMFRPHSIIILNNILMKLDEYQFKLGPILLAIDIYDNQFANWLIEVVVGTFDEQFQADVKEQFNLLFEPVPPPVMDNFIKRLKILNANLKRYQTDFIDIDEVQQYLFTE